MSHSFQLDVPSTSNIYYCRSFKKFIFGERFNGDFSGNQKFPPKSKYCSKVGYTVFFTWTSCTKLRNDKFLVLGFRQKSFHHCIVLNGLQAEASKKVNWFFLFNEFILAKIKLHLEWKQRTKGEMQFRWTLQLRSQFKGDMIQCMSRVCSLQFVCMVDPDKIVHYTVW